MDPSLILLLTPLISAGVTQLVKWLAPKTPKILVVCAPAVIGAIVDGTRAALTGTDANLEMGALAGAGGNALYSLSKTVKAGPTIALLAALLIPLSFTAGCASTTPQQRIAVGALIAGNAAQIGATYDLQKNPGHVDAYRLGIVALDGLLKSGDYTAAKLQAAMQAMPIKEFQGANGTLIVSTAVLAYDIATQVYYDPQTAPGVQAFAQAIKEGLQRAVDNVTTN